jgi:lipoprotein NlpD
MSKSRARRWVMLAAALLLWGSCAGCGTTEPMRRAGTGPGLDPASLPLEPLPGSWHTVSEGEDLAGLARRYQVSVQDLAEINDLSASEVLHAGREIFVPGPQPSHSGPIRKGSTTSPSAAGAPAAEEVQRERGRFAWPLAQPRLSSRFGRRWGRQHEGIDLVAPLGTPILAAAEGQVIHAGEVRGYGNLVLVRHDRRFVTVYAHCLTLRVKEGQKVSQGEVIAEVGNTGHSTGPHLHFEIRDQGKARNPLFFLDPLSS